MRFKIFAFLLMAALARLMTFSPPAYAAEGDVQLTIKGEKVNIRQRPTTRGAVLAQCGAGSLFAAAAQTVKGSDGKPWYKLTGSLGGDGNVTPLAQDPRFKGAPAAYVSAQQVADVQPLPKSPESAQGSLTQGPLTQGPAALGPASSRFYPVVVDDALIGGYQGGKWMNLSDLTFTVKGKNLSLGGVLASLSGDGTEAGFDGLPKGAKLTALVAGQKKAAATLRDPALWVSFLGSVIVDVGELPEKEADRVWVCIHGALPGADAPTVSREAQEVRQYAAQDDPDTAVWLQRDPAKDGVSLMGEETPYENYSVTVRYGGEAYPLDGDNANGLNFFSGDFAFDCAFVDVNGDGQRELVLHCNSETRGAWVYQLSKDGPRQVLRFSMTGAD